MRRLSPTLRAALVPVLALWLPVASVQAQSVQIPLPLDTTTGAPALDTLDIDRLQAERIAAEAHRGNYVEPSEADLSIVSPLRPIEARGRPAGSAIRFDGERRTLQFALFVPRPDQVRALRVSTLSSINVLPERSQFRVFVNDTLVGEGRLENFTNFGTIDFPLGAATVLPGQNNVRIQLVQYHRIYCGPDASFALWSDIDLANSGAVLASAEGISGQDGFLMGLAGAAATGAGIEIRGAEALGDYRDAWVSQITQRISAALGGDPIPFRFTPYWSVQGQQRSAARVTFLPSTQNRLSFRTAGDGAQVMVVEFLPGERPHAMPEFETMLPPVARRAQPQLIATQRPVALSEMGFHTTEAFDRYTLIQQRFRLPDDYVVLTNDKAELALDYVYIPDLPAGSALLVHINGTNVRLLPLRGEGGQVIEQFPIRFEARLLRSGINTLAFEAMVPGDPPDLPCPVAEAPFLTIGENSTLSVPYSPSMYLADMHLAFAGLTPASVMTNDMTGRSFDANDVVTLRAALSGGERPEAAMLAPRLTLLSLDDFGSIPSGGYRIDRRAVEQALTPPPAAETQVADSGAAPGNLFSTRRDSGSMAAL
ncbi:MAG: cellulose biosynthesis cyclic di-GMP-binding regulatory protein BcsB, partial [Rhodobacteraceae bacterium]|nr:cellulose biosynthesis cyclic di-GMP-binding regulatory protein BcsB [Paracoccaceae bacterium]